MRLDGRKDIQFVKSAGSVLYAELKTCIRPPLLGNNEGRKRNTQTSQAAFTYSNLTTETLEQDVKYVRS